MVCQWYLSDRFGRESSALSRWLWCNSRDSMRLRSSRNWVEFHAAESLKKSLSSFGHRSCSLAHWSQLDRYRVMRDLTPVTYASDSKTGLEEVAIATIVLRPEILCSVQVTPESTLSRGVQPSSSDWALVCGLRSSLLNASARL